MLSLHTTTTESSHNTPTLDLNIDDPFLRIGDVERSVGLKKSSLYEMIRRKEFPAPYRLCNIGRASGWLLSEILIWKRERIAASRQEAS